MSRFMSYVLALMLLAALLVPYAMAQTPEEDRRREYNRQQEQQREEQQRRAQEEMQRQQRATEEARKRDQQLNDETTKNIEDHSKAAGASGTERPAQCRHEGRAPEAARHAAGAQRSQRAAGQLAPGGQQPAERRPAEPNR